MSIAFVSSACVMTLELVAGRIIAPYVGVSLYTWTSVIGVVLAGISLGNFLGGWLADRWASPRLLGTAFVLAGLLSFGALATETMGNRLSDSWNLIVQIVVMTAGLFLLPSIILGTISPILVKLSVSDLAKTGSIVGRIYAASSLGSIVGTFATGFWLISWFGTRSIVWGVGVLLIALGLLFLVGRRWPGMLLSLIVLVAGSGFAHQQGWLESNCTRETNYFCIRVADREADGHPYKVLVLDRMVHSYSSLEDPTWLIYDYEKMYAEVTAYQAEEAENLSALFIGGGGYTFPRYMETIYPDSVLDVIEIDPGVTDIAYQMLGVRPDTEIVTYNEDARLFLQRSPTMAYDLIFGDAFDDFSVPYHLTTKEFNDYVRAWLKDDGLYVINMIDGSQARFMRSMLHTLRQTFRHVYLSPTTPDWRSLSRNTFVIIATDVPLDTAKLSQMSPPGSSGLLSRHLMDGEQVADLLAERQVVLLTDDYAPVDQMLMAVFREEVIE